MPETRAWIRMSDGVRLAATLYLPEGDPPWPVVLEALPYRKDDATASYAHEYRRLRDEGGLAVCRLDLRGTGSSEGLAEDEYPPQEQRDLVEVVDWLATREWSSGAVGMYGTSYSGFNSIQVAMERPPALRAIAAIYATDDRYTDDVHYGGGILRALDLIDYPLYMVAMNALPPVPSIAGEGWREAWRSRVEGAEPWLLRWLQEQADGPYWRHGSLRPDYRRISCPMLVVAGWADGYHNMAFRSFGATDGPVHLLIGPWAHSSAESSIPGPRIDLVPELIRWWDRWLRGPDREPDGEAPIRVFLRRSTRLEPDLAEVRGEWRSEETWPPARLRERRLEAAGARAPGRPGRDGPDALDVRGEVGAQASIWCAGQLPFGQPSDQRPDEAYSLVYEWDPLDDEVEVLGHPRVEVSLRSTAPVAFLSAKLCDVFPDGESVLVDRAVLNLTHRNGHATPEPLDPGTSYRVRLELDATGWIFEAGHRIRLDLAGSDWPNVWPPPGRSTLVVDRAGTALVLPVLEGRSPAPPPRFLPPPEAPAGRYATPAEGSPVVWRIEDDVLGRERRIATAYGDPTELPDGTRLRERYEGTVGVSTSDPARAWAGGRSRYEIAWPEATVSTEARLRIDSDAACFRVRLELDAAEGGEVRWTRTWERTVPRRLQ